MDLEVDVNGEETFMVNKKIISSYSGKLSKMFGKSAAAKGNLKLIFHDFPGGSKAFEFISRFCYSNGRSEMNPHNIAILHSAAHFMEMNGSVLGTDNLVEQTLRCLEEARFWTWPDLLSALKKSQELLPTANVGLVLDKCFDSLIGRITEMIESSPSPSISSTESRHSCDTRSTESQRNVFSNKSTWWFEDLLFMNPILLQTATKFMLLQKIDHVIITKFLMYYQKMKFPTAKPQEKCKIVETVIDSLFCLDRNSVPSKCLFGILRVCLGLKINKCIKNKLEVMIGSQLDQATLDNLLVPSPLGTNYLYDVNLVLRLVKAFLEERNHNLNKDSKKVVGLMDMYLAEVAPDPCLKSSKFLDLIMALPDSSRDSYDEIYSAMYMYLEVHSGLSEEEKMKLCGALNYEKLTPEARSHLSQNSNFPSEAAMETLISKQSKLKSLIRAPDKLSIAESQCLLREGRRKDGTEQIVLFAGELDLPPDHEGLQQHLQGMQCRVMELEKVCRKMQSQMAKMMKLKSPNPNPRTARSVPKFCS